MLICTNTLTHIICFKTHKCEMVILEQKVQYIIQT